MWCLIPGSILQYILSVSCSCFLWVEKRYIGYMHLRKAHHLPALNTNWTVEEQLRICLTSMSSKCIVIDMAKCLSLAQLSKQVDHDDQWAMKQSANIFHLCCLQYSTTAVQSWEHTIYVSDSLTGGLLCSSLLWPSKVLHVVLKAR